MERRILGLVLFMVFLCPQTTWAQKVVYPNLWLAVGTEPYWNVTAEVGESIVFTSITKIDSIAFPFSEPEKQSNGKLVFKSETKAGSIELTYKKEACSDGMSDDTYPYSTSIKINTGTVSQEFSGCGKYVQPTQLNDIWVLTQLKGEEVVSEKIPTMELHLENNKVGGNAGCNGYQGNFSLDRDLIRFDQNFIATRMYCEDQKIETAFLTTLAGNRFVYEILNNQLFFKTEGHPILVFKKVD